MCAFVCVSVDVFVRVIGCEGLGQGGGVSPDPTNE